MRPGLIAAIAALILWLIAGSWYWVCPVKGHCDNAQTSTIAEPPANADPAQNTDFPAFAVKDQTQLRFQREGSITAAAGATDLQMPADVSSALDSLADLMQTNPGYLLQVTGNYLPTAPGESSGLALARARTFGAMLASRGIDSTRLVYFPAEVSQGDTSLPAIGLALLPPAAEEPAADSELFASHNVYFDFGSSALKLDAGLRQYFSEVIRYLRSHAGARLGVTGHTDNVGSEASNQAIGLERAHTVAGYLADFGISPQQMQIDSKGETQPLASDDSEEGMAQNRRVEIRLLAD